jgi:hypothetical protein
MVSGANPLQTTQSGRWRSADFAPMLLKDLCLKRIAFFAWCGASCDDEGLHGPIL